MSIKISELLQQPTFSSFRIVAGLNGLNRYVSKVNILDFEYDELQDSESEALNLFEREALVLSSLLFAKDHPEMILKSVKLLIQDGASALAIKEVYYHELPYEVIDYANQHQFVILMFERSGGYFETLITEVTSIIEQRSNEELYEQKLKLLIDGDLTIGSQRLLSEELFPQLKPPYYAVYTKPDQLLSAQKLKTMMAYHDSSPHSIYYLYQSGILMVGDEALFKEVEYPMGISQCHENLDELSDAIKEALCAYDYANQHRQSKVSFTEIGIYRLLLPLKNNKWIKGYCELLNAEINKELNSEELMQTAACYVRYQGDILKTADALHIHKNTVRYRIGRLREVIAGNQEADYFDE